MCVGLMRMDTDAGPDVGLPLGEGDDVVPFALAGRDVQEAGDAALPRILKHFGLALDEPFVIEVAMAVDQPQRRLLFQLEPGEKRRRLGDRSPVLAGVDQAQQLVGRSRE